MHNFRRWFVEAAMFLANMEITVPPNPNLYMSLETSCLYKTLQEEENSYVFMCCGGRFWFISTPSESRYEGSSYVLSSEMMFPSPKSENVKERDKAIGTGIKWEQILEY